MALKNCGNEIRSNEIRIRRELPVFQFQSDNQRLSEGNLVTAHEFGHNWGSEHDPDVPECSPSAGPSAEGEHSGTSGSFSDPQL